MPELKVIKVKPDAALVAHLERLVARAKTGEIQGMVGLVIFEDATTSNHWRITDKIYQNKLPTIIGEVQIMLTKLCNYSEGIPQAIEGLQNA